MLMAAPIKDLARFTKGYRYIYEMFLPGMRKFLRAWFSDSYMWMNLNTTFHYALVWIGDGGVKLFAAGLSQECLL